MRSGACSPRASAGQLAIATDRVVIATGGIGGLFLDSTNPAGCFGQGIALAAHAGAKLSDLEFIQFHPTAFDGPSRPMPLLTEAIRGDGAILIDETGRALHGGHAGRRACAARRRGARGLAPPRAKAIGSSSTRERIRARILRSAIPSSARSAGWPGSIPPTHPIPVRPAAHYHMGGIAVDMRRPQHGRRAVGLRRGQPHRAAWREPARQQLADGSDRLRAMGGREHQGHERRAVDRRRPPMRSRPHPIRRSCGRFCRKASACCGIATRSDAWCGACIRSPPASSAASDPALVGLMIAVAAYRREESRGGHCRTDFPDTLPAAVPSSISLAGRARRRARDR